MLPMPSGSWFLVVLTSILITLLMAVTKYLAGSKYHIDKDCHPGIPSTNTPTGDGSALTAHLPTHSKNHATGAMAEKHTDTHHTGKVGVLLSPPLMLPSGLSCMHG